MDLLIRDLLIGILGTELGLNALFYAIMCYGVQNRARICSLCFEMRYKRFWVVGLGHCLTLKFVIMAKQKGILKLKGTIGDYTFYKTKDGYLAREKGGIDKDRIMNDPAFKRTRENGMEFGTAGKGGQLIRKAERVLLRQASDHRLTSRLVQVLMQVIKSDPLNDRGKRT